MTVFRILLPNSFYGFSGFAKEVTHAKTVIPRELTVRGMHEKPSLFSSLYFGRNCCQAGITLWLLLWLGFF